MSLVYANARFGTFTVLGRDEKRGKGTQWRCECDCGEVRILTTDSLRKGNSPECRCARRQMEPASPEALRTYEMLVNRLSALTLVPEDNIRQGRSRHELANAIRTVIDVTMRKEGFSLPEIGKASGRHHTSILRSIRKGDPFKRLAALLHVADEKNLHDAVTCWKDHVDEVKTTTTEAVETSYGDDRETFKRMVERLRDKPVEQRPAFWEASCRFMFPNSWVNAAATPPNGIEWPTPPPVEPMLLEEAVTCS